jgi:hypothetical protein
MSMDAPTDPSERKPGLLLALPRYLGIGVTIGLFLAGWMAAAMLPHPLENTMVQIPPNLKMIAAGITFGLVIGLALWAVRTRPAVR